MVLAVAEQLAVILAQLAAGRVVDIDMSVAVAAAAGPPVVAARLAAAAVLVQQVAGVLVGCSYIPRIDCYRIVYICNARIICGGIIAGEGYCVNLLMIYIPHWGILHPTNLAAEGVDLLVELGEVVAVGDEVVGNGNGATLLNIFNFRPVAGDCFLRGKGPLGSLGKAAVTELFGCDDGRDNELTWEVMGEVFVLCPGVKAIKEDVALPGGGEALHLLGSSADDDVFASLFAPGFAKLGLRLRGDGDAAAAHFVVEDATSIDLGDAKARHVVDRLALARAREANEGKDCRRVRWMIHVSSIADDDAYG